MVLGEVSKICTGVLAVLKSCEKDLVTLVEVLGIYNEAAVISEASMVVLDEVSVV